MTVLPAALLLPVLPFLFCNHIGESCTLVAAFRFFLAEAELQPYGGSSTGV